MKGKYIATYIVFLTVSCFPLSSRGQNYVAGDGAGHSLTDGIANTMVGTDAGYATTGAHSNSFFGYDAGLRNVLGSFNCMIGYQSGVYNSGASYNSYFGANAGGFNSAGENNTAIGYFTMYGNTGNRNTALGSQAGRQNSADENTFIGYGAGLGSTSGTFNTFVGFESGYDNGEGAYNTFMGNTAGYSNVGGNQNSFFGSKAGYGSTTGSSNTFMGSNAGSQNGSASNNTFLGANSGILNTASDNSFVGNNAGTANTTGNQNAFLGSSSGPKNTTGAYNIFIGSYAGQNNTSGAKNSFLGIGSGSNSVSGSRNTVIGYYANVPSGSSLSNATAVGALAYVSTSNSLVLGAINGTNGATSNTNVGVGTSAPAYLLHVNGAAAKPGGGTWSVASDSRLKKNVKEFNEGLEVIKKIRPVTFMYNGKAGMPTDKEYIGVIAQEMQKIAPYTVGTFRFSDTTGRMEDYLDYDANAITYVLINAMKEQQTFILEQQTKIDTLLKQMSKLLASSNPNTSSVIPAYSNSRLSLENSLGDSYPNPNQSEVSIPYTLSHATSAFIKIYSMLGMELYSVSLPNLGKAEIKVDTSPFASGMYVYRLLVDGRTVESKSLQVLK